MERGIRVLILYISAECVGDFSRARCFCDCGFSRASSESKLKLEHAEYKFSVARGEKVRRQQLAVNRDKF